MFVAKVGDVGSDGDRMRCSPWQSVHTGASRTPREAATPWMLALNSRATSA